MASILSAWLRLLRIALLPTLVWDVLAGAWLAGAAWSPALLPVLVAGLCVYHGGMALNDFADRKEDARHRPARPLPGGRISPAQALGAGLGFLMTALGVALLGLPSPAILMVAGLCILVLVYDLGGPLIRGGPGPLLLALARGGSLNLAALALGQTPSTRDGLLRATGAYVLWFLFTARLARKEESGTSRIRGLQYLILTAATPLLLVIQRPFSPGVLGGWLLLAAWLVGPELRRGGLSWSPPRVEAAVRRCLGGAPLLLGLALLEEGIPWGLPFALLVSGTVRLLARRYPPE
ncbi:MAG: UbiA family prenyltransferase [Planctomycetota bacterium]